MANLFDSKRATNFESEELCFLTEEYGNFHNHIKAKLEFKTGVTKESKEKCWHKITFSFHSKFPLTNRTEDQLKKKISNIMTEAREWGRTKRRSLTGGGTPPPEPKAYVRKMIDILGEDSALLVGIGSGMESDAGTAFTSVPSPT